MLRGKEAAENAVDELQERTIFLQGQIEKANATFEMWKMDFKAIHDMEMARLDEKRLKMGQLYEMELKFHKAIIIKKEQRIEEVKLATKQALKMMEHPRLMKLLHRQLQFEK